jgi:hypothetical protein
MLKKKKKDGHGHGHGTELKKPTPLTELGYETEDLDPIKFGKAIGAMFAFVGICAIISIGAMWFMSPNRIYGDPTVADPARKFPPTPSPLLQSNITKATDMHDLRQKETAVLKRFEVKDGSYSIPIDMAIDKLAKSGLPKTPDVGPNGGSYGPQDTGTQQPERQ